jgi:hypothetical protein
MIIIDIIDIINKLKIVETYSKSILNQSLFKV